MRGQPAGGQGGGRRSQPLLKAAAEGDAAAVARMLAAGADPNALVAVRAASGEPLHNTALCAAATFGRLEVARLLLDAGADPSLADGADGGSEGITPLMAAAGGGQLEVLRLLLGLGAAEAALDQDSGGTAFHFACYHNRPDCVEALARAGCDVSLKNKSGQTGRHAAETRGSKEVARRLRALARQPFVGVLVELAGLVGAAEHNGKRATVMSERPSRGHHTPVFCRARVFCLHSALASKNAMCGSRMAVELTIPSSSLTPLPPCGARCCATCRRSSATRSSCWSRRPGAAARGSAWTCGRRTLCWRTCRPARGALSRAWRL